MGNPFYQNVMYSPISSWVMPIYCLTMQKQNMLQEILYVAVTSKILRMVINWFMLGQDRTYLFYVSVGFWWYQLPCWPAIFNCFCCCFLRRLYIVITNLICMSLHFWSVIKHTELIVCWHAPQRFSLNLPIVGFLK